MDGSIDTLIDNTNINLLLISDQFLWTSLEIGNPVGSFFLSCVSSWILSVGELLIMILL